MMIELEIGRTSALHIFTARKPRLYELFVARPSVIYDSKLQGRAYRGVAFGGSKLAKRLSLLGRVADSDPVFLPGSGSGFHISLDPDLVSAQILEQKKSAERSLKVIYQNKT